MAKRFTDSLKYKNSFIRGLQGPYKLLWDYLYHDCSHAGIWIVDFEIAQIYLGSDMQVNQEDALKYFNEGEERVKILKGGEKWFIRPFVEFQYGELNPDNRVHKSVIDELKKYGNIKGLISPLKGAKDKDKVKDIEKEKEINLFESEYWGKIKSTHPKRHNKLKSKTKWENLCLAGFKGLDIWNYFKDKYVDESAENYTKGFQTEAINAIDLKDWLENSNPQTIEFPANFTPEHKSFYVSLGGKDWDHSRKVSHTIKAMEAIS